MEELVWCFKIKNGLRLTREDPEEALGFERLSEKTLEELKNVKSYVWRASMMYYAVYYKLHAILRYLGVKSENHSCSLIALKYILKVLGEDINIIKKIEDLKEKREEAQYYGKPVEIDEKEVLEVINQLEELKK